MTEDTMLRAPFSEGEVAALNAYQADGRYHPFTCGNDRGDEAHVRQAEESGREPGLLVAAIDGWHCPACGYSQTWAHRAMVQTPGMPG